MLNLNFLYSNNLQLLHSHSIQMISVYWSVEFPDNSEYMLWRAEVPKFAGGQTLSRGNADPGLVVDG